MGNFALKMFCICSIMVTAMLSSPRVCAFKEYKVGGGEGWREPNPGADETNMYDQWAAMNRFRIGDSLRFEYTNDSVIVVDKWGYYHCNTSNPIAAFTDQNTTVIKLDKPGPAYFISGTPNHCKNGQRLLIDVINPHPVSHSPGNATAPPEPYGDGSPSPSPLSSSSTAVLALPVPLPVSMTIISTLAAFVCSSAP